VAALEQTVQAQERGLELGASRVIDVLDARRRLLKARADQAKARYDYIRDVVALQVRSGEVGQGDIARWDGWFEVRGR
jgi:outer membrane protein